MDLDDAFPPPPKYFELYHPGNPTPPEPPAVYEGKQYKMFGGLYSPRDEESNSLEEISNMKELFVRNMDPSTNEPKKILSIDEKIDEMKKLNVSIVKNYRELVQILKDKPCAETTENEKTSVYADFSKLDSSIALTYRPVWELKIQQIRLIFTNIYFLLNSLREMQGKAEIRDILKKQIDDKKKLRERLEKVVVETRELFKNRVATLDDIKPLYVKNQKMLDEEEEEMEDEEI